MVSGISRPGGVVSTLADDKRGDIVANSGAMATLAPTMALEGFTPLELMDAALAGCLVISVRLAAKKLGWIDRLGEVRVEVNHRKAPGLPSRVANFESEFSIEGILTDEEKATLIAEAHVLCTVGNTFEHGATVTDKP